MSEKPFADVDLVRINLICFTYKEMTMIQSYVFYEKNQHIVVADKTLHFTQTVWQNTHLCYITHQSPIQATADKSHFSNSDTLVRQAGKKNYIAHPFMRHPIKACVLRTSALFRAIGLPFTVEKNVI